MSRPKLCHDLDHRWPSAARTARIRQALANYVLWRLHNGHWEQITPMAWWVCRADGHRHPDMVIQPVRVRRDTMGT